MRKYIYPLIAIIGMVITLLLDPTASAASFNAGYIIDDAIMTNSNSMSVSQIQQFLNSKVPTCDTNGTQSAADWGYPNLTHAQFATQIKGWPGPPYTCLKDLSENGVSSAQLIYNLSRQYQINPQAIIVTLQKESSLVTDTWPLPSQYRTAAGYGCPDSGPNNSANCSSTYYGFTNQVSWMAKMYRAIISQSSSWYSPYVKGTNFIQWNPDKNCGGSNVSVDNWSTAALYDYTPYQPNTAALNAGYGMGDGCSAYGNRNFFLYFTDWFGSPNRARFSWTPVYQAAYTDLSFSDSSRILPPYKLHAGQRVFFTVAGLNTGTETWIQWWNPTRLGTVSPNDRSSMLCEPTWINCSRPALVSENTVRPGAVGTFGFWATVPTSVGVHRERLSLVAEGAAWFNDPGFSVDIETIPTYRWSANAISYFTDAAKTEPVSNGKLIAGQKYYATLTVTNSGNVSWDNTSLNPVRLAPNAPNDRKSILCASTWINCTRVVNMSEGQVAPGQIGTFNFEFTAPKDPSLYGERFNLLIEGKLWMIDPNLSLWMGVQAPSYVSQTQSITYYTDSTMQSLVDPQSATASQRIYVVVKLKNTGNLVWRNRGSTPFHIGTYAPTDRSSRLYDVSWLAANRPSTLQEASVMPGSIGTFGFWITTPPTSGALSESFNTLFEGLAWSSQGSSFTLTTAVK